MSWRPTDAFLYGKLVRPFLPLNKHPELTNDNFKNLYPGDEVYVFEVKNEKWARGYTVTMPFPKDYTITSVNLDELPGVDVKIAVFPLKYVRVLKKIPIAGREQISDSSSLSSSEALPSIRDSVTAYKMASEGQVEDHDSTPPPIPPLPEKQLENDNDLIEEIKKVMSLLTSHVFALYSIGEFRLFNKLSGIYYKLDETRIMLTEDLLTSNEIQVAKETATQLLSRIPKKLGSKAARLNSHSYDLDNKNTDISGYKVILARDTLSGELLSNRNTVPSHVAANQVLCSLEHNFPINAHNRLQRYTLKAKPNKKLTHEPPSHILVDFKSVSGTSAYQPPGFTGMTAYLYIRNNHRRLTEAFAVYTNSVDDLVHVENISAAMFRNIPSSEIENSRIYLVAVLTEEIDLKLKPSNNVPQVRHVKKGVAAGVTDITRVFSKQQGSLESGEFHQFTIKLFGSYRNKKGPKGDDSVVNNGWGETVDRIIAGSNHGIAINPRAEKLIVSVKEFKHQFTGNFNPVGVSTPIARVKPIFYDPMAENYERIYLKVGKVSLLNSITRDDLLTFEVSTPNNDMITFAKASNQQEKRSWQFVSVCPDEVVGEIIKVNGISLKNPNKKLPKDDFIVFSLYINGVLAGEGQLLYKSGSKLVEFNKKKAHTIEIVSTSHRVPMAQVEISTEYVGKVFNSDISIDNIFQFERFFKLGQKGVEDLAGSLVAFSKLETSQLVKYFPELLNSLYQIIDVALKQPKSPSVELLKENLFRAMVHLIDTVFGKQDQYLYLLNSFAQRNTNLPSIGVFIVSKISEVFSNSEAGWNSVSRSVCRVISLLLKLAASSVRNASNLDQYSEGMRSLLSSITVFFSIQSSTLINDQVLILDIVDFLITFRKGLDDIELFNAVTRFVNTIGLRGLGVNEESVTTKRPVVKEHKIMISKLLMIQRLLDFDNLSKNVKPPLILKSIDWALEVLCGPLDIDGTRLACTILNSICTLVWNNLHDKETPGMKEVGCILAKFLPSVGSSFIKYHKYTRANEYFKSRRTFTKLFPTEYPFMESSIDPVVNEEVVVEVLIEISVVFCFIARIGQEISGADGFVKIYNTRIANDVIDTGKYISDELEKEDIKTLISAVRIMRQGLYYPEDKWLSLYSVIIEGSLVTLELINSIFLTEFIPPMDKVDQFDRHLWGNYFRALLKLGTLPPVAIEHLSDIPRKACYQITGDVRLRICGLLEEAWDKLAWRAKPDDVVRFNLNKFGGYQVEFINSDSGVLQDLVLFALQRVPECQVISAKILWSILVSEYLINDSIVDVEKECLMGLYEVFNRTSYKPKVKEQDDFIDVLYATIRLDREDIAFNIFFEFVESLRGFLDVLNELNSVPVGSEFDDDRTFHRLNITAYLKNANKPELFNSFINTMYEQNLAKNDFVQAALSLELLASTFSWDQNTILPPSFRPKFPEQTSFERKESLLKMIANNYVKGNSLERAIDTYNELLDSYNEHTYDLKSFSYVHNKLAKLYLDLEASDKLSPSYFKVAFIGRGFPLSIRGKDQIYEGLPFEHITSIHERLLRLYPGASIISDDIEAQKLKEKGYTGRYLHVTTVEPVSEISDKLFNTSIGVRQYARNKDLKFFTIMKKIPGASSVFDLWTEETTYETYVSFPTLMNRSDIKSSKVVKLSPLDNAIKAINDKNNELIQLESLLNISFKEKADITSLFNDLSRQLAGTVDSPVNGGVNQYRGFIKGTELSGKERLLKNAFDDLTNILSRCLLLHGKLVSHSMRASHDALVELFKKNFKEEIENLKISTDYENSVYNYSVQSFQQSQRANENRNTSTASGISSSATSVAGSRLARTASRTSSASSNSGLSSGKSAGNTISGANFSSKPRRSAANWRNIMKQ